MVDFLEFIGFEITNNGADQFDAYYKEADYEIFLRKINGLICITMRHGPFERYRSYAAIKTEKDLQIHFLSCPFTPKYYSGLYCKICQYRVPVLQ